MNNIKKEDPDSRIRFVMCLIIIIWVGSYTKNNYLMIIDANQYIKLIVLLLAILSTIVFMVCDLVVTKRNSK